MKQYYLSKAIGLDKGRLLSKINLFICIYANVTQTK